MNVSSTIKGIQNIMRKDTGVDGDAQRIGQIVWMIFLKIFDDKERETELLDPSYKSPIPEKLRWRNWAENEEGLTGDALLEFVNNELFKTLKNEASYDKSNPRSFIIRSVFEDAYNYMKSGTLLRQVINKINEINFNKSEDRHLFNDIYEQILKDLQSAGNAGEYYTPRPVTQFVVNMIQPKLGEKILDPASGTGGFLICALEYLKEHTVKTPEDLKLLQEKIHGIDKKPLPHLLCMTNMILHGIDEPKYIRRDNALTKPLRDITDKDRYDIVITNPPFGGVEEDGVEQNFPSAYQTKETADLFLILIIALLKQGGRAGIVLPDGSLTGEGVKQRIRQKLLEDCNVHTIVRLPNSVFQPYATVATNLIFLEKGTPTKEVWYYEHKLPETQKSYSKTKPLKLEELDPIKDWWDNRVESEQSWKVDIKTITERGYDLDVKNPNKKATIEESSSEDILKVLEESLQRSKNIINELKKEIYETGSD